MTTDLSPVELPFLSALAESAEPGDRQLWLRIAADYLAVAASQTPRREATIATAVATLAQCDEATRAAFARRLTPYAAAADAVAAVEALGGEAALVVLSEASALPRERLSAAANGQAAGPARAVAQRPDLDSGLVALLIARDEIDVTLTLAHNAAAPIDAAQFAALARLAQARRVENNDRRLTDALLARTPAQIEHATLFLEANSAQRTQIVAAAQRATLGRRFPAAQSPEAASAAAGLERSAMEGDWRRFEAALAEEFGFSQFFAARIATDAGGEPLAVALAALGAPSDATVRILAARDLHEGRDYHRIAALARLKDALNPAAARLVIAAMIGAPAQERTHHRPQYDPGARLTPSRSAASGRSGEATPAAQRRRRALALTVGRRFEDERG